MFKYLCTLIALITLSPSTAEARKGPPSPCVNIATGEIYPCPVAAPPACACSPCLHGCSADCSACNDEPYTDDGLPIAAIMSTESGGLCTTTEDGGFCDNGYAWMCDERRCWDTTGSQWPHLVTGKDVDATVYTDGECAVAETVAASVTLCGFDLSVCDDDSGCIDVQETRYGCQYFSDEGPDDMLTCMLTVADELCGGCVTGQ